MTERLSEETRATVLDPLFASGWQMVEGRDAIEKTFTFADFTQAFGWMTQVAMLTTHDVDGLSTLDAKLARKMDSLQV